MEHPVALGSFRSWIRLGLRSGGIDRAHWARFLAVSLTTLLTSPLRLYERARYGAAIERTRIHPSPVFILGHWRTGTTYLHSLLSQDPQFGYISTFQAMVPGFCLSGERWAKPALAALARRRHPTREIDNIPLSLDAPQEEAFALANVTPCASLHVYSLPRRAREIFERYALLRNLPPAELAEWTAAYLALLRTATLRCGGKRLVLKDPAHTGRIPVLLKLFPEAKFVHIVRDPYRVLRSTVNTYRIVLRTAQLQGIGIEEIEELVLEFFERLMRAYLEDRSLIAPGNLVEVRHEDLEAAPMDVIGRIYEGLGLGGFDRAESALRAYADSVSGFQKNVYRVDDATIERVNRHWQFALDTWGYQRRAPGIAAA